MAALTGLVDEPGVTHRAQVVHSPERCRVAIGKRFSFVIGPILTYVHGEQIACTFNAYIEQSVQARYFAKRLVAADGRMPRSPTPSTRITAQFR